MLIVTDHGEERIRKRCGVKRKAAERLAKIAFEKGITLEETTGELRSFLRAQQRYNGQANNIRVYGDKVYIFCNEYLVTVLNIPKEYQNKINALMLFRRNNNV